jgi:zinc and cadmium transporter
MNIWLYTIVSVFIVSLVSLVGVFTLALRKDFLQKAMLFMVSFAVGALFGDAFIHLLPEAFEKIEPDFAVSLLILSGIAMFFVLEKFVRWRHCHIDPNTEHYHPVVTMNIVGDMMHNFIDGIVIGSSFVISIPIGLTTTLAVIVHEIPQEIGDFAILLHGGMTIRKAIVLNFLTALTAVLGAVLALLIGTKLTDFSEYMLPITAGGFIYIAGSDLIPELRHDTSVRNALFQFLSIALGIGIMASLLLAE